MGAALLAALVLWAWRRLEQHAGADWGNRQINRLDGLNRLFCRRFHRLAGSPIDLPESGPALVVANHISGLDPLLLIAASPRPLRFLIAREEYERFGLNWLFRAVGCIPVDRDSRPERALRAAERALRAGEVVALFPEGHIHAKPGPRRLKPGVWKLAEWANCPVHPVRIEGVRGAGRIFRALVLPSRVELTAKPPVACPELSRDDCLAQIAHAIGRAPENRTSGGEPRKGLISQD